MYSHMWKEENNRIFKASNVKGKRHHSKRRSYFETQKAEKSAYFVDFLQRKCWIRQAHANLEKQLFKAINNLSGHVT